MNILRLLASFFVFFIVTGVAFPVLAASHSPLLISVKEAVEAKKADFRTILVDVRGEEDFKKIHIPGSINMALHFVKTKSYLKNMHVILVNRGYGQAHLLRQAELLNKKRIKAEVLAGGLAAWAQQGRNLTVDDAADHSTLHNVDPAEISEGDFFRVIDVSPEKNEEILNLLSGAEHVPVRSPADVATLAAAIDEPGQSALDSILLFNLNGDYSMLEGLPGICRNTLFFLEKGSEEYNKILLQQRAILEPKSKRIKTIGGCETCPPAGETR